MTEIHATGDAIHEAIRWFGERAGVVDSLDLTYLDDTVSLWVFEHSCSSTSLRLMERFPEKIEQIGVQSMCKVSLITQIYDTGHRVQSAIAR